MQGLSILILAILIAFLIIIVCQYSVRGKKEEKEENFDTYYNHTLGAEDVYNAELKRVGKSIDFSGAQLVSRYTWASRDPTGRNVYDKYYEAVVQEKNNTGPIGGSDGSEGTDGSLTTNKISQTPYDSKFDIHPIGDPNSYNLRDMYDNEPMFTEVMGETIVLSQANY
jgi:hypothetical protein